MSKHKNPSRLTTEITGILALVFIIIVTGCTSSTDEKEVIKLGEQEEETNEEELVEEEEPEEPEEPAEEVEEPEEIEPEEEGEEVSSETDFFIHEGTAVIQIDNLDGLTSNAYIRNFNTDMTNAFMTHSDDIPNDLIMVSQSDNIKNLKDNTPSTVVVVYYTANTVNSLRDRDFYDIPSGTRVFDVADQTFVFGLLGADMARTSSTHLQEGEIPQIYFDYLDQNFE